MLSPDSLKSYLNFWCSANDVKTKYSVATMKVRMPDTKKLRRFYFGSERDLDKARVYLYKNHIDFTYTYWCDKTVRSV